MRANDEGRSAAWSAREPALPDGRDPPPGRSLGYWIVNDTASLKVPIAWPLAATPITRTW
jgi:hypothetical protein